MAEHSNQRSKWSNQEKLHWKYSASLQSYVSCWSWPLFYVTLSRFNMVVHVELLLNKQHMRCAWSSIRLPQSSGWLKHAETKLVTNRLELSELNRKITMRFKSFHGELVTKTSNRPSKIYVCHVHVLSAAFSACIKIVYFCPESSLVLDYCTILNET